MPRGHYEGTCPFKHSGPCWSNANFHGDITSRAWDDKPALARCEARRQAHARKINVTYKPLRAPKKKGPYELQVDRLRHTNVLQLHERHRPNN